MRIVFLIAGIALLLMGAVWIGQGTGYFPYPSYSIMIDDIKWAYAGGGLAALGALLLALARRR